MEDKKNISEFRATMTLEQIRQKIKGGRSSIELLQLFDQYPIYEVRKEIIEGMISHNDMVHPNDSELIEQRITDLKEEDDKNNSGNYLWRDLLNWYVFNSSTAWNIFDANTNTNLPSASRAIEFAIGITKRKNFGHSQGFIFRSVVLKIITGRLKKDSHIYRGENTPSLKPFLLSFLTGVYQSKHPVIDYEMVDVKRVISIAIKTIDFGFFLPHIEKVLEKIYQSQEEEIKGRIEYELEKDIKVLQLQVYLKEVIRFLKEEIEEENKEESEVI